MNKQNRTLITELKDLFVSFFRPCRLMYKIFELPRDVRKLGIRKNYLRLIYTIISLVFAFMLKATNMLILHKFILLGIMLFLRTLLYVQFDIKLEKVGKVLFVAFIVVWPKKWGWIKSLIRGYTFQKPLSANCGYGV